MRRTYLTKRLPFLYFGFLFFALFPLNLGAWEPTKPIEFIIPAGTGAGMNRLRVAASSRDAALRAQQRKLQEALIAPGSAAQEHAAELAQGPEAAMNADPLADVAPSGNGSDADAGEYLND